MTETRDPGDAPDPNESPTPTYPTPPAPPIYAPGDPAAYPPPGPVGYAPPGPGPQGYTPPPPSGPQGEISQTGPMGYAPPPPPPAKKTNWVAIAVLIGLVVVIGGGFFLFRDRLSSNVAELAAGDCFDEPTAAASITDVQHQPCNSPHFGEVFAVLTHPAAAGEAYPVVSGFDDYILENCVPVFETYTGREADTESELNLGWFQPTLTGWGEGDRGFTCYVSRLDDVPLNASIKNIGTAPLP